MASKGKPGVCDACGKTFIKRNVRHRFCSVDCGVDRNRYVIFERDKFRCAYCGRTSYDDDIKLHIDHVHPKSRGGKDVAKNVITSCNECNMSKYDKPLDTKTENKILAEIARRNETESITPSMRIKERR